MLKNTNIDVEESLDLRICLFRRGKTVQELWMVKCGDLDRSAQVTAYNLSSGYHPFGGKNSEERHKFFAESKHLQFKFFSQVFRTLQKNTRKAGERARSACFKHTWQTSSQCLPDERWPCSQADYSPTRSWNQTCLPKRSFGTELGIELLQQELLMIKNENKAS